MISKVFRHVIIQSYNKIRTFQVRGKMAIEPFMEFFFVFTCHLQDMAHELLIFSRAI